MTLHNDKGERVIGFDNAHKIPGKGEYTTYDHKHHVRRGSRIKEYHYGTAGKLMEDFWQEVNDFFGRTAMKTLVIGIASYEQIKARTIAIAHGEYKPKKDEPKVWFRSIELLAQVLSTENKVLLEIIKTQHPQSITELATLAGREVSNTSRTLKNMKKYGLVDFVKGGSQDDEASSPL